MHVSSNSHYTLPPGPPATAWARHIDAVRRERDLSQTATYRLLGKAVGLLGDSRSAFRPYLVGKKPNADQAKALAAIIGWPKAELAAPDPILGKPADLATAFAALTLELAAWRAERAAWEMGVLRALAATEGPARSALLDALAPQPRVDARP